MPVIEGADLTTVSTKREAYPEDTYLVTIKESELSEDKRTLIIKTRIEEPSEFQNREFWDWINIVQNDGKTNRIGLTNIKRYLEAVFGEGSPESLKNDTDPLNGHQVRLYLTATEYKDKSGTMQPKNEVKRVMRA